MENPHEERQALLLERIIKNVNLVNDALVEMNRSLQEINTYNTKVTVVGELWEGVSTRVYGQSMRDNSMLIFVLALLYSIVVMLLSI
jgi:DASH complex subunit DAD4